MRQCSRFKLKVAGSFNWQIRKIGTDRGDGLAVTLALQVRPAAAAHGGNGSEAPPFSV